MLGSRPKPLLIAVTNAKEPGGETELRQWQETVHMPNVLRTPGVVSARRFSGVQMRYGTGRSLLLYELDITDAAQFNETLEREMQGEKARGEWRGLADIVVSGIYMPLGAKQRVPRDAGPNAMTVVVANCTDPAQDAEFNRWYDTVHIPNVLQTPGVLSAQRYVCARQRNGRGQYLALYELGIKDAPTFNRELQVRVDEEIAAGRRSELLEMVVSGVYMPVTRKYRPATV